MALAENVHLLWGGKYLDWGSLKSIITLLNDPQILDSLNDTADSIWIIARVIRIRDELRGSKEMPLSDLMFFCSALRTSDPRDKILALQGISCSKSHPNLAPNDQISAREAYQNTARYLLLHQHLDSILPLAGIHRSRCMEGPPSWVPDWSAGCVNPFYSPEGRIAYRASGETRQNTRANESLGTLVFAGYRVDKITAVGSILDFQDQDARTIILEKRRWEDDAGIMAKDGSKDPYRDGEPLSEALWRTFIGDRTRTERPAPASSERSYQAHRENDKISLTAFLTDDIQARLNTKGFKCSKGRSRELWAEYNEYYVDGSDVRKSLWAFWSNVFQSDGIYISRRMFQKKLNECLIQHVEELTKLDKDIWEYSFLQSLHCLKRKFCVTEKGYIGLVPPATETGDWVCVFRSSSAIYDSACRFIRRDERTSGSSVYAPW